MSGALQNFRGRFRRLANRCRSSVAILHYHRVAPAQADPHSTNVTPGHFMEQMEVVKRTAPVLSLDEIAKRIQADTLPRRAFGITFDDGYLNNLRHAGPVLERLGLPATVFVTTGMIGKTGGYWWDRLWRCILMAAVNRPKSEFDTSRGCVILSLQNETMESRLHLNKTVHDVVVGLPESERESALQKIQAWSGHADLRLSEDDFPMDENHLRELTKSRLITVGGHTISHCRMTSLTPDEMAVEVRSCRERLQAITGTPVNAFAYPFGWNPTDYGGPAVSAVQAAGYSAACCSRPAVARRDSIIFELPRLWVDDVGSECFVEKVGAWWKA